MGLGDKWSASLELIVTLLSRSLNDYELTNIGILDANHRRAILHKISSGGGGGNVDEDFNSMLGDLSSVIKDLECFSVVCNLVSV